MIGTTHERQRDIPDGVVELPPAVTKAVDEYRKLVDTYGSAQRRLDELATERDSAVAADRSAYAKALRAGKGDPAGKAVAKVDAEIEATTRRQEALALAVSAAREDMVAAVEASRGDWNVALESRIDQERERYRAAIDALEAARTDLVRAYVSRGWLRDYPERSKPSLNTYGWGLAALSSPNGEERPFADVVASLRQDAEPVEARQAAGRGHVKPLAPVPRPLSAVGANVPEAPDGTPIFLEPEPA